MIPVASSSTRPAPRPFTRCAGGVQQVVDRRFNPRCHDADRIIRGPRLCDLVDLRQPDRRGTGRGRPDHAAHPGVTGCVHRDRAMRSPLAWTHQRARRTQRAPGGRAVCCLERKVEFRPATFRLRDGYSQSDWMAPDGSSLLTLGASSVQTAPDGSRPIVWMIKRMIKGCPTESYAKASK
jgi:hypothetical protein